MAYRGNCSEFLFESRVTAVSLNDADLVAQREERTVVWEGLCTGRRRVPSGPARAQPVPGAASVALRKDRPVGLGERGRDGLGRSM
jgi:hypothetical protein